MYCRYENRGRCELNKKECIPTSKGCVIKTIPGVTFIYKRCLYLYASCGLCPYFDEFIKSFIIDWPAIRIAWAILFHGTDKYLLRPNYLSPGNGNGQKKCVSKWDIGGRNFLAMQLCILDVHAQVR